MAERRLSFLSCFAIDNGKTLMLEVTEEQWSTVVSIWCIRREERRKIAPCNPHAYYIFCTRSKTFATEKIVLPFFYVHRKKKAPCTFPSLPISVYSLISKQQRKLQWMNFCHYVAFLTLPRRPANFKAEGGAWICAKGTRKILFFFSRPFKFHLSWMKKGEKEKRALWWEERRKEEKAYEK